MAASVRIEDEAFGDLRYDVLAGLCGLSDADHARGKMALLWRQCTALAVYVLPVSIVAAVLGENGASALVESGLGEACDGGIRVRGTRGRIEWLKKLKKAARKGGLARAASRQSVGKQKAASTLPTVSVPAPAPSPSDSEKKTKGARAPAIGQAADRTALLLAADVGFRRKAQRQILSTDHAARYAAVVAEMGVDVRPLNLTGQGEVWLSECLQSRGPKGGDLDEAVADCHRAIENREKQARAIKSVRYFGPGMWESAEFMRAIGWTADEIAQFGKPQRRDGNRSEPYVNKSRAL